MASALNEESVEKKLKSVINTQDSIQSLSLWIIHHKNNHAKIVELWMKVLKKTVQPSHRLTLFYLCNDVVQTCKKKKAFVYNATFKEYLREAASLVRDHSVKGKVERIFNIWGERGVYDHAFIQSLQNVLSGQPAKSPKIYKMLNIEDNHAPISPVSTPQVDFEHKEAAVDPPASDTTAERDAEESARILAEFKPHEMIDQITAFKRQEVELQVKVSQLSHLKLDASSLEAIKQLKDRTHGNDFSNHFEDSCTKLEDLVKRQSRHLADQNALIETLSLSETFYEEQYREARIVANAYKNFGARINNMKKKLDELKRSMPEQESPVPSPDVNAPSPGNTPPFISGSNYGYNPAAPTAYGQGLPEKTWAYNGAGSLGGSSILNRGAQDTFQESPPLEAPSPEGTPPDLNLDGSEKGSISFESRLASFFDRNQSDSSHPPVYTPQLSRPVSSSSKLKPGDDDGGTTPLDDETPTTPVQDENLLSPPKRNTPPKKENPIDFLSRLISQTQKAPVKTGAPSFLDSLTLLTSVTKKPDTDSQQQVAVPQSWAAWKMKTNDNNTSSSQPMSPLSYVPPVGLYTSSTSYPPTPTMVPPPIPLPVPPPISLAVPPLVSLSVPPPVSLSVPPPVSLSVPPPPVPMPVPPPVSLSMGMNVPPPPPPPFSLGSAITSTLSSPAPGFQHKSPGQKESWPDLKSTQANDHSVSSRSTHNSVLKELVPVDEVDSKPEHGLSKESSTSSVMDPDVMDIVSDEDDEKQESNISEAVDAKTEFAQKLKQKSSQGMIKSHVFVPNPERPNLMTLTVSDEDDLVDDNNVVEASSGWSDKSHKSISSRRSRSRSYSREKDRSHKHKKKKKHRRNHSSDDDDSRLSGGDNDNSKGVSSVGSVVKKIDPHTSRNSKDSSKGDKYDDRKYDKYDDDRKYDKYDDDRKYDKYDEDRKYDRYDNKEYSGRGDYRPNKSYKGSKDLKNTVEAYTQAYRDALFQQYSMGRLNFFPSGPPPMDPRRSGYGKY